MYFMVKLQWDFNRISDIFVAENARENVTFKMRPFCIDFNL